MRLAELQQAFQERILHGAHTVDALVSGTERFDTASRLDIYAYAFVARLTEALAKTYPVLQAAMGEEKFADLVRAYSRDTPPSHFSIRYFGDNLSAFIANTVAGINGKVLSELARWEWLLAAAFDAADVNPLTKSALADVAPDQWPQLHFKLSPSLHRASLHTNAVQWWRAISDGSPRPARRRMAKTVEWAVWRSDLKTYFRSLKADEAQLIDCVANSKSFSELCEVLAESGYADNAPLRAATLLSQWFHDGWIVAIELS